MDRTYGVVTATVVKVEDQQGEGRVLLRYPWMGGNSQSYWAPVAAAMAGGGRGAWFMPEEGDEVLVAFNQGDVNHPYIIGFLWNGEDRPPSLAVRERMIRSVNGHAIRFLDATPDAGSLGAVIIEDAHGNRITLSNGKITIKSIGVLELNAPTILLAGDGYSRVVTPNSNPI